MRIVKNGSMVAAALVALLVAVRVEAIPPTLQALQWLQGEAQISEQGIRCEIPTLDSGFTDGSFQMGIWNTFGEPTLLFPNPNAAFANACGAWMELQNNLANEGIDIDHLEFTFKIDHARRFRQFVPTRNAFPIACRPFRREVRFMSARLNGANSSFSTPFGVPNVTIIHPIPIVSTQLFQCLREQYAPLPADVYASFPLIIRTQAFGTTDSGERVRSNILHYTLTLRHTCGNGRVDDGEFCDPAAPNTCFDSCSNGACLLTGAPCATAFDCAGICLPGNDPQECTCAY